MSTVLVCWRSTCKRRCRFYDSRDPGERVARGLRVCWLEAGAHVAPSAPDAAAAVAAVPGAAAATPACPDPVGLRISGHIDLVDQLHRNSRTDGTLAATDDSGVDQHTDCGVTLPCGRACRDRHPGRRHRTVGAGVPRQQSCEFVTRTPSIRNLAVTPDWVARGLQRRDRMGSTTTARVGASARHSRDDRASGIDNRGLDSGADCCRRMGHAASVDRVIIS